MIGLIRGGGVTVLVESRADTVVYATMHGVVPDLTAQWRIQR